MAATGALRPAPRPQPCAAAAISPPPPPPPPTAAAARGPARRGGRGWWPARPLWGDGLPAKLSPQASGAALPGQVPGGGGERLGRGLPPRFSRSLPGRRCRGRGGGGSARLSELPRPEGRTRAAFANGRSGPSSVAQAAGRLPCGAGELRYCRNFNWEGRLRCRRAGGGGIGVRGVTRRGGGGGGRNSQLCPVAGAVRSL